MNKSSDKMAAVVSVKHDSDQAERQQFFKFEQSLHFETTFCLVANKQAEAPSAAVPLFCCCRRGAGSGGGRDR